MPLITRRRVDTAIAFVLLFALGFVEDIKHFWEKGRL